MKKKIINRYSDDHLLKLEEFTQNLRQKCNNQYYSINMIVYEKRRAYVSIPTVSASNRQPKYEQLSKILTEKWAAVKLMNLRNNFNIRLELYHMSNDL